MRRFSFIVLMPLILAAQLSIDPSHYIVGSGDVLEILISGKTSFSYITEIDLQGKIKVSGLEAGGSKLGAQLYEGVKIPAKTKETAVIGFFDVAGLTLLELKDTLNSIYNRYYPGSTVDLRLLEARAFNLPVLGEVMFPGNYPATPIMRVSDIIEEAGGFKPGASMSKIKVIKSDTTILVDLYQFYFKGVEEENPYLGDIKMILVPKAEKVVRIKGAIWGKIEKKAEKKALSRKEETRVIQKPQVKYGEIDEVVCEYIEGDRVKDAINKAGGLKETADLSNITIIRNGERIVGVGLDFPLKEGDIVYVPSLPQYIYVIGEVQIPGAYEFKPGMNYMDYIGMAGGFTEYARKGGVYILRKGQKIKVEKSTTISRGDVIVVPRVVFKFWEDYVKIISVATTVLVTWLTLKR